MTYESRQEKQTGTRRRQRINGSTSLVLLPEISTVNPFGYMDESDTSNNTVSQTRTIPGAIANATTLDALTGVFTPVNLSGCVVGLDIPARLSASWNS